MVGSPLYVLRDLGLKFGKVVPKFQKMQAKEVNTDNHVNYLPFICNEMIIVSQFNRLLPCHLSVIRSPKH